jgi:hypothetical protein
MKTCNLLKSLRVSNPERWAKSPDSHAVRIFSSTSAPAAKAGRKDGNLLFAPRLLMFFRRTNEGKFSSPGKKIFQPEKINFQPGKKTSQPWKIPEEDREIQFADYQYNINNLKF